MIFRVPFLPVFQYHWNSSCFMILLEGSVWVTFLGVRGKEEDKSKPSTSFFIIQEYSSFVQITLLALKSNLKVLMVAPITFVKKGLTLGKFWVSNIHETGNRYGIWTNSYFQKILSLVMILISLDIGGKWATSTKNLILLNIIDFALFLQRYKFQLVSSHCQTSSYFKKIFLYL